MLIASLTLRFTAHPPSEPPHPARPGAPVGPPCPCGLATIVRGRRRGGGARVREVARDLTGTFPRSFQRVRIPVRGGGARGRAGGKVGRPYRTRQRARRRRAHSRQRGAGHRLGARRGFQEAAKGRHRHAPKGRTGASALYRTRRGMRGHPATEAMKPHGGDDENGPPHGVAARMRPTGARRDRGSGRSRASRRRARGRPRAEARRPRRPRPPRARRSRARAYGCSR